MTKIPDYTEWRRDKFKGTNKEIGNSLKKTKFQVLYILAENAHQAASYARDNAISPRNYRYVYSQDAIHGAEKNARFVKVGQWYENPNADKIMEYIEARGDFVDIKLEDSMIKKTVSPEEVVEFLNSLISIDKKAISGVFQIRIACNKALANHPTVQVQQFSRNKPPVVGFIGILNGLFGTDEDGWGPIAMAIETDGFISKFKIVEDSDKH